MHSYQPFRHLAASAALVLLATAGAGAQADQRFTISADGQEVTDATTKLVWRRCAEGMKWDGKVCAGKATKYSFAAAKKYVAAQSAGGAWRLPTKEEMLSLVDKTTKKKPVIDLTTFPNTPKAMFWAVRPEDKDNLNAWIVDFRNGHVFGNTGTKVPLVRMVRSAS